ncbi:MAG: peptidase C11, partial [Ruminococcus sp.]|nr:peptidase C11 [Ruminococcus sp.]
LNYFDSNNLVWEEDGGSYLMDLPESQWKLVHKLDLNMFYDDGEGYVDLGLDNVYSFNDDGKLVADVSKNWLAIDGQTIAYYHMDTVDNGDDDWSISGYVPAFLNGERVNLILVFDNENPNGYIAGADTDYSKTGDTQTVAKSLEEVGAGDKLEFICDYYTYDGEYQDSYILGDEITLGDKVTISNTVVGDGEVRLMYCFTDIYNQEYWTEAIVQK